jgi:hypothetical protein
MGRTCSIHVKNKKWVQFLLCKKKDRGKKSFGRSKIRWEEILKRVLEKYVVKLRTELNMLIIMSG